MRRSPIVTIVNRTDRKGALHGATLMVGLTYRVECFVFALVQSFALHGLSGVYRGVRPSLPVDWQMCRQGKRPILLCVALVPSAGIRLRNDRVHDVFFSTRRS